ncbi:MAG: ABC transporter ATP-binding protein [Gammaproteobacteria bacterium]
MSVAEPVSTLEPVISLDNVSKRFGAVTALDNLCLAIHENEFFALLGPSGCGKTTLLRLLAGFEIPDTGTIALDGQDLVPVRAHRRPLNMMFQSYALFPHLSVWDNVAYGLRMERAPKAAIRARVDEMLELVHLSETAGRKPDRLSGGQRQRVALARALIKRPRVLLLDEPMAALDKKLKQHMQYELKKLQHEVGITFIVVTHDQEEALAMADRIALMRDGRLAQLGTSRDLYESPRSHFVADFIGTMNFIRGTVRGGALEAAGSAGLLKGRSTAQRDGEQAWLAVRPEHVRLHTAHPGGEKLNVVRGRLDGVNYLGKELSCFVRIDGCEAPITVSLSGEEAGHFAAGEHTDNETLWCSWPTNVSHILS